MSRERYYFKRGEEMKNLIQSKLEEFRSIVNMYVGEVSDSKEAIMVIFEPKECLPKIEQFLSQSLEEAYRKGYDEASKMNTFKLLQDKIRCANCGKDTSFYPSDFDDKKDLNDVFCSEECRYTFETGRPGEEY
jgi:hypothetical protein